MGVLDCEKDELLDKINNLKATIKLLEQAIDCKKLTDLEVKESEAESVKKSELVNEVQSLQDQLKQSEDHNDKLKIHIQSLTDEQSEVDKYKAELVKCKKELKRYETKLEKYKTELENCKINNDKTRNNGDSDFKEKTRKSKKKKLS